MITPNEVKECLEAITQLDSGEIERKHALIENAVCFVEGLIPEFEEKDRQRVVMLAAARANYYFALLNSSENGISSFKAGDVAFTKAGSGMVESARAFYESALSESTDLISRNGFIFRTV